MEWYDTLQGPERLAAQIGAMSVWQALGFAAVLWACKQPVIYAPAYGVLSAAPFLAAMRVPNEEAMFLPFVALFMAIPAVGLFFQRHIRRGLRGPWPFIAVYPPGIACAFPFAGPFAALIVVVVVKVVRRRDHLDLFD